MAIEFRAIFVFQLRDRWFIKVVLVMIAVGFVGFSVIPLIGTAIQQSQPSTVATPTVNQSPLAEQRSQLEAEARSYEVVLKQEPENRTALQSLAQVKIQLGDLQGAITPLEKLTTLYPKESEYYLVLGQVYAAQNNYDQAIAAYDQAIENDQQDFRPVLSKAVMLQQQGKTEQAKSLLEKAAAIAPPQYKETINKLAKEQFNTNDSTKLEPKK